MSGYQCPLEWVVSPWECTASDKNALLLPLQLGCNRAPLMKHCEVWRQEAVERTLNYFQEGNIPVYEENSQNLLGLLGCFWKPLPGA